MRVPPHPPQQPSRLVKTQRRGRDAGALRDLPDGVIQSPLPLLKKALDLNLTLRLIVILAQSEPPCKGGGAPSAGAGQSSGAAFVFGEFLRPGPLPCTAFCRTIKAASFKPGAKQESAGFAARRQHKGGHRPAARQAEAFIPPRAPAGAGGAPRAALARRLFLVFPGNETRAVQNGR